MYWTHLIFALLHGLLISWNEITASKPGYLDFDNLPETNFSCEGKVIGGYYADVETGCQMFHVCTIGQKGEVTDIKFLCLNGTVFDQETRVCERIDEVDCAKSEDFFGLNLELYGNTNFGGIQAEAEFEAETEECEECSTDEEYEESEPTTLPSTTTTSPAPPPSSSPRPAATSPRPYQPDPLHQLLALHPAFGQGKPPPPRVINNAFSPTAKPTPKPFTTSYPTRRPDLNLGYKSRYTPDSQSYGSLNLQQRERPYYFTPATEKSNYHHFHSGDTSFGHSFDATRPYNFQYFHSRKLPDDKASVSVVTSTSTSTSVKTSAKSNATEYPTGYEDYQDDIQDHAYFEDVPKLRQKRELHPNHKYQEEEVTTPRHKNHKYDDETSAEREEFLQNLLGSIDLDERVREKMTDFFKKEDEEIDKLETQGGSISAMGNTIGQVFPQEIDSLREDNKKSKADKLSEWTKHFDEMKKDINLNYTFELNLTDSKQDQHSRQKRQTSTRSTVAPSYPVERTQPRRTNIDTEQFRVEPRRKKTGKSINEFKPVSESIEDDFTTVEYRKSSKQGRSQPKSTTSLRAFTFNYELTSALPDFDGKYKRIPKSNVPSSKEIIDFVHEEGEHPIVRPGKQHQVAVLRPTSPSYTNEDFEQRAPARPTNIRSRSRVAVAKRTRPTTEDHTSRASTDHVNEPPRTRRVRIRPQHTSPPPKSPLNSYSEQPIVRSRQRLEARGRPVGSGEQVDPPLKHRLQEEEEAVGLGDLPPRPLSRVPEHSSDIRHRPLQDSSPKRGSGELEGVSVQNRYQERDENGQTASLFRHWQEAIDKDQIEHQHDHEVPNGPAEQEATPLKHRHQGVGQADIPARYRPQQAVRITTDSGELRQGDFNGRQREQHNSRGSVNAGGEETSVGRRPQKTVGIRKGSLSRGGPRTIPTTTEQPTAAPRPVLTEDPDFSCEGKVKGGFYADTYNECRAFFICSQGMIDGPLLKTHFACGDKTKFNQRSRTCQAEDQVECDISSRYYHLNNDFLVPVSEDELKGSFEPMKQR